MAKFLLAIDQGTTGSTVVIVSPDGRVLGRSTRDFTQHFPQPGWVEHELEEIWASVSDAANEALKTASVTPSDCAGIGITNQRETTALWDRASGKPVARAIVWQDRRTSDVCQRLKSAGHEASVRARTGLVLDPYFSGTKVSWLLDNVDGLRARADKGELAFGTIDSFLVHRLTGGASPSTAKSAAHVTDVTNASRTLLFDINELRWSDSLLELLRVPRSVLPEVKPSVGTFGATVDVIGLSKGTPIAGIAGDQQAALFGQACFDVGDAKCTYGTGAFILSNTGRKPRASAAGLLTTIAWQIGNETTYALEGSAFIAGAAVQWLRDGLGIIKQSSDVEALAATVPDSGGVVFVPALAGLGAPHWDPHARGLLTGMTRGTTAAHIARATLEGIAFQVDDLVSAMEKDIGSPVKRLRVDGGASENTLLMQFQSDVIGTLIDRPECIETTALGAAYLAGLGVGVFANTDAIRRTHRIAKTWSPSKPVEWRTGERARWADAVRRALSTAQAAT